MSAFLKDIPAGYITNGQPYPMGQPSISLPLASQGCYARVWTQPFLITGSLTYSVTGLSTGLFSGSYIVSESDRQPLGGDYYTFNRDYAELPSSFSSYESFAYTFPGYVIFGSGGSGNFARGQRTKIAGSRLAHDFFYTGNPDLIAQSGEQRFYSIEDGSDSTLLSTLTFPSAALYSGWVASGVEFVAEDSQLSRYAGNIWERTTRFVRAQ